MVATTADLLPVIGDGNFSTGFYGSCRTKKNTLLLFRKFE